MAKTMETVAFRTSAAQRRWMRKRAKDLGVDRSELLRGLVDAEILRTQEEVTRAANVAEIERRLKANVDEALDRGAEALAERMGADRA